MKKTYIAPGVTVVSVTMTTMIAESKKIVGGPDGMDDTLNNQPSGNPQLVRGKNSFDGEDW
ncbi:MAG: hypothetical protein HUK00_00920 [Bacteroidaceae bacterium]|nr:hypothetical protein [Bacteroidaceae bacterium]